MTSHFVPVVALPEDTEYAYSVLGGGMAQIVERLLSIHLLSWLSRVRF